MENQEPTASKDAPIPTRRKPGNSAWKPGISGNPAGKPVGTKNKLTLYREAVLAKQEKKLLKELPEILDVVIAKSKEGDIQAIKLFLDRVMAAKKVADDNEEGSKGPPTININISGAKASRTMGRVIEAEFEDMNGSD